MTQPYSDPAAPGPNPTPTPHGARSTPDLRSLPRNDQAFMGAGVLALICSFLPFARFKLSGFGSATISAWHGVGALAGLLLLAAIVVAAVLAFAASSMPDLPVSARFVAVALAALALLFFVVRWLTLPGGDVLGHHYGYSLYWGGYATLIVTIVMVVFGVLGLRESGEAMPWAQGSSAPPTA
jgi:hypothetical protein